MLNATGEVRPLDDMENEIIRFAISHYRGQMSEVARRLKIGRSTLYRKLDEAAANGPPRATQAERTAGRAMASAWRDRASQRHRCSEAFEPWLGSDRQRRAAWQKRETGCTVVEVSLS
jgi:hypothetical protein